MKTIPVRALYEVAVLSNGQIVEIDSTNRGTFPADTKYIVTELKGELEIPDSFLPSNNEDASHPN